MNRHELEHILCASAGITGTDRFVITGSHAILGQFPDAPAALLVSMEADVFSLTGIEDANLIDGSTGESSPFHQTFGYFARGVGEENAVLPEGWKDRLIPVHSPNTCGATVMCPEIHDLALSKLAAGREKDVIFIRELGCHGPARTEGIRERIARTPTNDERRSLCLGRLFRQETMPQDDSTRR